MTIYVTVIKNNVLVDASHYADEEYENAAQEFSHKCLQHVQGFDSLDVEHAKEIFDSGLALFDNGSVQIHVEI
jgi:hypothetical protein